MSVAVGKARGRLVTDVLAVDVLLPARKKAEGIRRESERDFDRVYVEGGALSSAWEEQGGALDGLKALVLRRTP